MLYISPPLTCAPFPGMNQGRQRTETIQEVQRVDTRWFKRLINAPLKGALHLVVGSTIIIV